MTRYVLPGERVFPEGITEGSGTTFFVGGMGSGVIYRGDTATGVVAELFTPDGDDRPVITGLAVDSYGRLIACDFEGGRLLAYDLAGEALVASPALPAEETLPNDVVVTGDTAFVTDTRHPVVWRLPAGRGGIGEPEVAIDLASCGGTHGVADPAYLNGIVAHPAQPWLLVAAQGDGGVLWRIDLAAGSAAPVDLGGYGFNADGMLVDGGLLYGVTNRGETIEDATFMISVARLAPDWLSGSIVGELADPGWDCPTTLAKVDGRLLIVCSQLRAMETGKPPRLPFEIAATDFPAWS